MKKYAVILCALLGCRSSQDVEQPEPFDVEEDFDTFMDAPPEPLEPPKQLPVEPAYEDEYRIEYTAGALPWAKPGYKVIFHKQAEISTYDDTHPGWPDMARVHSRLFIEEDGMDALRTVSLPGWPFIAGAGQHLSPEVSDDLLDVYPEFTHHYSGFYLSRVLDSQQELHLFECSWKGGPAQRHIYAQPDYLYSCERHREQAVHVPDDSPLTDDFDCTVKELKQHSDQDLSKFNSFSDHCIGDDAQASRLPEVLDVVTWFNDRPPNVDADRHGYNYSVALEPTVGTVKYSDRCHRSPLGGGDDPVHRERCEDTDDIAPLLLYREGVPQR